MKEAGGPAELLPGAAAGQRAALAFFASGLLLLAASVFSDVLDVLPGQNNIVPFSSRLARKPRRSFHLRMVQRRPVWQLAQIQFLPAVAPIPQPFSVAFAVSATVALLSAGLILLVRPRGEPEMQMQETFKQKTWK
jgi:hypothetical protein